MNTVMKCLVPYNAGIPSLAENLGIFAAQESVYAIQLFGWLVKLLVNMDHLPEWESSVVLKNSGTKSNPNC